MDINLEKLLTIQAIRSKEDEKIALLANKALNNLIIGEGDSKSLFVLGFIVGYKESQKNKKF